MSVNEHVVQISSGGVCVSVAGVCVCSLKRITAHRDRSCRGMKQCCLYIFIFWFLLTNDFGKVEQEVFLLILIPVMLKTENEPVKFVQGGANGDA